MLQLRREREIHQRGGTSASAKPARPSSDPLRERSLVERESAAIAIQRVQRGRIARRQVHLLKQRCAAADVRGDAGTRETDDKMESAAIALQRVQRGRMARRRVNSMRATRKRNMTKQSNLAPGNLKLPPGYHLSASLSSRRPNANARSGHEERAHRRSCVPTLSLDRVDASHIARSRGGSGGNDDTAIDGAGGYSSASDDSYESEFTDA